MNQVHSNRWGRASRGVAMIIVLAGMLLVAAPGARAQSEPNVFALTAMNSLLTFNESRPDRILKEVAITGVGAGEQILGIDVRPATGQLYGLSSASKLYVIDPATGAATQSGAALIPALAYTSGIGIDFNPTVDRLRIVTDSGQNLRVNVDTGVVADNDPNTPGLQTDTNLAFAATDRNTGKMPNVVAAAYTNSLAGATTTTLYVIDAGLDILATQNPPNNGTLNTTGALQVNASELVGFDIFTDEDGNNARAVIRPSNSDKSMFYTVDLSSGRVKLKSKGTIGSGLPILDIAIAKTMP